jgi:hypothetical protein
MKKYATVLSGLLLLMQAQVQAQSNFDIFSYNAPETFTLRESKGYLCYEKNEGKKKIQAINEQ